ncbi:endonuclease/exonuclease/phosphatase family protein (macronuclear) [Tetrahymena thermophila SB210]|uniref:sphingomyelin phosphodiesterase n=1 Tax=Tetrahymena thermophila (strain SB210) TaxID=312017 RepID=I7LTS5_TETTS|nr:endonuclease/exonuclease/phosphatase family protein [Tetrahymena thermophila SB210]EAR86064.2 endonuclease/exonuclease/phosphatase family protein [Tetrahymena thermophila SB210]|eukprot:XP_976659.2 endonuclease/exonuclease/phosphatase family protein [Tetrahymena thermophila SB210]
MKTQDFKSNQKSGDIESQMPKQGQKEQRSNKENSPERSQQNISTSSNNIDKINNTLNSSNFEIGDRLPMQKIQVIKQNSSPKNNVISNYLSQGIRSVRVLTYNIFLRPPPIKNNKDDYKNERTKLFLNSISDFDIVCLQELFGFLNQRKHKIIFNAMKQGFFYHATSPSPSFFSSYLVDGGLVTISRFPIIEKSYRPFKYGVLSDNLSQKGVLYTKIQANDSYIHLFNTHLQASYVGAENNVKATVITRVDQLILIKDFIKEQVKKHREKESDIIMICGDFNVNARPQTYPIHYLNDVPDIQEYIRKINPKEFSEYDILRYILSDFESIEFIDTLRRKFKGESPITYADTYIDRETQQELPMEEALTIKEDLLQKSCLDYIIQLKIPIEAKEVQENNNNNNNNNENEEDDIEEFKMKKSNAQSQSGFVFDYEQVFLEKFFVKNQPFTQLSDHYGVYTTLRYVNVNQKSSFQFKESVISSQDKKNIDNKNQHSFNNASLNE